MADAVLTRKQHCRTEAERKDVSETPAVALAAAGHERDDQMDAAHLRCVCYNGHHLVSNQPAGEETSKPSESVFSTSLQPFHVVQEEKRQLTSTSLIPHLPIIHSP